MDIHVYNHEETLWDLCVHSWTDPENLAAQAGLEIPKVYFLTLNYKLTKDSMAAIMKPAILQTLLQVFKIFFIAQNLSGPIKTLHLNWNNIKKIQKVNYTFMARLWHFCTFGARPELGNTIFLYGDLTSKLTPIIKYLTGSLEPTLNSVLSCLLFTHLKAIPAKPRLWSVEFGHSGKCRSLRCFRYMMEWPSDHQLEV